MDHLLVLLLLLWSSGLQTEGKHNSAEPDHFRLVGGDSRCAGTLELKHQGDWRPVAGFSWTLKTAAVVCRDLDCGSAVSVGERKESSKRPVWWIDSDCVQTGSVLRKCVIPLPYSSILNLTCLDSVRLVDGTSLCSGRLEVKSDQSNQWWSSVCEADFDQQDAVVVCRELGCGAPSVLQGALYGEVEAPMWTKEFQCGGNESALLDCRRSGSVRNTCSPGKAVGLTCSEPDHVRLVGGDSRCAGTLELKHEGGWRPMTDSVCTLKAAAVVCRHLDCGSAVSVQWRDKFLERSVWWFKSKCVQSGSALRECVTLGSSTSYILDLTCSDSVRLVDGTSLCSGRLEVKSDQSNQWWSSVCEEDFDQQDAKVVCRELGCGAPSVLQGALYGEVEAPMWTKEFQCGGNESALLDCRRSGSVRNTCSPGKVVGLTCSEPDHFRLVGGDSRCAGTLELKHEGDWRPVSHSDSTLKAAAGVCRDLKCGSAVSVKEREGSSSTPVWWLESDCVQSGSALRECVKVGLSSFSSILDLICSESDHFRLVGGDSRCAGTLELKHEGDWRPVRHSDWTLKTAAGVCRDLNCGFNISVKERKESSEKPVWRINSKCVQSGSALRECVTSSFSSYILDLTCSDSVRLVDGTSLCSGRLEVKSDQSNQWWSSVCEADFDQQDAKVVCRELGCGAPSVLQGALYGEVEAPMWTKEFQCGGNESALLDCRRSGSVRNTCSPGKVVGLTCSEPVRLVGGDSRCAGTLELKHEGDWRPVRHSDWTLKTAAVACRDLDCGSAVSVGGRKESSAKYVWMINSDCVQSGSALRECAISASSYYIVDLTCSDPLQQPNISMSSSMDGVSEAQQQGFQVFRGSTFTIICSIQPQYPGGSFQLTFTSTNTAHNYTQSAVNHSAHFLFPAAEPAHQGNYRCVYHICVFSHNFSSESRLLSLTVLSDPTVVIIRMVVLLLTLLLLNAALYFYCKASRGQMPGTQENIELDDYNLGVPAAEGEPTEEEGAQGAE